MSSKQTSQKPLPTVPPIPTELLNRLDLVPAPSPKALEDLDDSLAVLFAVTRGVCAQLDQDSRQNLSLALSNQLYRAEKAISAVLTESNLTGRMLYL